MHAIQFDGLDVRPIQLVIATHSLLVHLTALMISMARRPIGCSIIHTGVRSRTTMYRYFVLRLNWKMKSAIQTSIVYFYRECEERKMNGVKSSYDCSDRMTS